MGFSEDDRIRSKNKDHNTSFDLYTSLRGSMSDTDVLSFIESELNKSNDSDRNKILLLVKDIASRRLNASCSTNLN